MKRVTLGGDRLGSGKKLKVDLKGYERSTHDMGYLWRSTMSAGTLVPFITEVALPGDTFDIDLDCDIKTHPTVGPLFGSYKVQLDVFLTPIRLYNGLLHNNRLGIGLNMASVKLPQMTLYTPPINTATYEGDIDNLQINSSSILSYLNIRGVGATLDTTIQERLFNAIPLLIYWDKYKNYYSNKQEDNGYVIHQQLVALVTTIDPGGITIDPDGTGAVPIPGPGDPTGIIAVTLGGAVTIAFTGATPILDQIIFNTSQGLLSAQDVLTNLNMAVNPITANWNYGLTGGIAIYSWGYIAAGDIPQGAPVPTPFELAEIDKMRDYLLQNSVPGVTLDIETQNIEPYNYLLQNNNGAGLRAYTQNQEGLALKTYQSDQFNNWLNEEFIDGAGGINEITAIDTSGGSFTIDALRLGTKVNDMLNRIAVSDGTYGAWLETVYDHDHISLPEIPIYQGGLIKELIFQEVVSNSESNGNEGEGKQPLGTLGGQGIMGRKHKGGSVTIHVNEPSYVTALISLTPRIDYSQGNKWDTQLKTMDDLHKPALDEIGFQDLLVEQMHWIGTEWDSGGTQWISKAVGKQPAWLNYMTNVNQTRGNFAIRDNEMFMTLNRRYERTETSGNDLVDLTTYIDPTKFNYSFAETAIDAQNFWAQISVDMTVRRKMSAKLMPNL